MRTAKQAFKDAQSSGAIDAWLEGKEIQWAKIEHPDTWRNFYGDTPNWNFPNLFWRPKPHDFPSLPEGEEWHNPDALTPTQIGEGYRLLLKSEVSRKRWATPMIDMWSITYCCWDNGSWRGNSCFSTYRIPSSTPFHWDKTKTIRVPLGPEDVPPGSVIRGSGESDSCKWCLITSCSVTGLRIWRHSDCNQKQTTWEDAMSHWQILRPGRNPATGWEPCWKEVEQKINKKGE